MTVLALLLDGLLALVVWASMPDPGGSGVMPQPLLDDEVRVDTGTRSRTRTTAASSRPFTVEGW